jgi:iron complex outermembrane receptor protein
MSQHSPQYRRSRRNPIGWLAYAAIAVLVTTGVQSPAFAQGVDITGRVVDAEGLQEVSGVTVELLTLGGGVVHATVTDVRGEFRLVGVEAGTYRLFISAIGYEEYRNERVSVGDETVTLGTIELATFAFILNPIVITASRGEEKALEAPAAVYTVTTEDVRDRPAAVTAEHVVGLPGVDNVTTGLSQHNVVTRGFNNVFSGALFILTDNRWASVPSLRFNAYNLIPSTDEDIDRIEMVLGPGSALYGPNVNQGVMHVITRSPLDFQGSAVSVLGGARSGNTTNPDDEGLFQGVFRTAGLIGDRNGYKVSGQYFRGTDWNYVDPVEEAERNLAIAAGADPDTLKIGARNYTNERFTADGRLDLGVGDQGTLIFAGGLTNMASSIEMTGIGSAQALDWTYWYGQSRLQLGNLFAQAYINMSNAGDTYTLRDGNSIVDNSFLFAGQLQYLSNLGERHRFVYGADVIRTVPRTDGTVHGRNENNDNITELGGYLQYESMLSPQWDVVLAARLDWHSVVDNLVFSPRAGVVYKPTPEHNFRLTYNRAFAQPTSINLNLDLESASTIGPIIDYGVRALGVPSNTGLTFKRDCGGGLCIRSPFEADPTEFQDFDVTPYWQNAIDELNQVLLASSGEPLDPLLEGLLRSLDPTGQVGTSLRMFDSEVAPLPWGPEISIAQGAVDVPALVPSITNTFEVGYKGLLGERVLIGADVYWQKIQDFIGPLRFETPSAMLDAADLRDFLEGPLTLAGLSPSEQATIIAGLATMPLATATWQQAPLSSPTDIFLTYRNFGDVDIWGLDLGLTWLMSDLWSASGSYSWVSDDLFIGLGNSQVDSIGDIALNAPMHKAMLGIDYNNSRLGLGVGLRGRYVAGFPVQSGVFVGEVPYFQTLDANIAYTMPVSTRTELVLNFRNFFSCVGASAVQEKGCSFTRTHQEIVGAPYIGSVISLRVRQPF